MKPKLKTSDNIKVIAHFLKITNYDQNEIVSFKLIHQGYTNFNFLIQTKDQKKWIYRYPHKKRHFGIEKKIYQHFSAVKFNYFSSQNGVYIRPYIEGKHPNLKDHQVALKIINFLKKIHDQKLNFKVKKQDWWEYQNFNILEKLYIDLFKKIVQEIENDEPIVFTHHDLNEKNILINDKQEIIFLDWEWARLDSPYFDYGSLSLEKNFKQDVLIKTLNLDQDKLKKYQYAILVFSHMWCGYMNSYKTQKLRLAIFKQIKVIFNQIR